MMPTFGPVQRLGQYRAGKLYVSVFIIFFIVVLLGILSLNLLLGERGLGSFEATQQASAWQEQTQGVTYAPPITHTRPFKILRLADRLPQSNAIVLGSSTVMGITADMFPGSLRAYNFALTGNGTAAVIAEAEYLERHVGDRLRFVVVGLDWSVGMLYQAAEIGAMDLSENGARHGYARGDTPWLKRVQDALTWPKVSNLATLLKVVVQSGEPLRKFHQVFFDIAGAPYRCADGATARDYDVINRGLCRGYRYDGSWTFAHDSRLTPSQATMRAMAATAASSKYTQHLCANGGAPNPVYLQRLGAIARRFAERNGRMVFLLPPLMPGMEQALLQNPRWHACLTRTKSQLHEWAARNRVTVIDAGAAERYGCATTEFSDEHHAYPECNARVLQRYFADVERGPVAPGLYRGSAP